MKVIVQESYNHNIMLYSDLGVRKGLIYLIILFFILRGGELQAQFYSTGEDPASAKWQQINTDYFQIIFQEGFINEAQDIANILDYYYNRVGNTLNHKPKKISVIVHNQTIFSNGYVAWAPKRMELYATPPQDISPDPWLEHLCIHELRHVVQIDKLNQGITKILSFIFGQQATGLVAGQLPLWYFEGDAVCTETAFSNFGRGRLPSFQRGIKTHLLGEEERYSFDKMLLGSYRNYVPDHYELGYQLTAFARYKYGSGIWSNIENHVARNSYTLLPTSFAFYLGLKKHTGLSQEKLYKATFNHLDSIWSFEESQKQVIEPKRIQSYAIEDYENYLNPICIDQDNVLTLKKGLSHIPQFVLVSKNSEKILFEPGTLISNDFSCSGNILVWAEYKPDLRWNNREFNTLKLLNIKTRRVFTLIKESRYFSPDINKTAEKIAVVKVDEKNNSSLVILNSFNGEVIKEINSSQGNSIQRPKWSSNEEWIYVIELTKEGKQISRYSLSKDSWEKVFQQQNADIQRILPHDGQVYFLSTLNGTDDIYVFNEESKEIHQLSSSRFGISGFDLDENGGDLIINNYTSQGFRIAKIPVERASWKKSSIISFEYKFANSVTKQESIDIKEIPENKFDTKPFRKSLNLFNFHSWIPGYFDFSSEDLDVIFTDPSKIYNNIHPGIMLLSQNKLSTVESILSYAYKDENHFISSSLIFKGQYPVIKLTADYGDNQLIIATSNTTWFPEINPGYSYDVDIYIPFNFTEGSFIKGLRPLVSVEYFDNLYYNYQKNYYIKGLEFFQAGLLFYSYKYKSKRDIIPQVGAIFDFDLISTPFESELFGYLYSINSIFYLPGGKNKGVKINLGYQYQNPKLYLMNGSFRFPRGIEKKRSEKLVKLYGDYIFPIAYPDWNLGSVLYLKRLRGSIFADYAFNTYRTVNEAQIAYIWPKEHYFSFGIELTADYHLLRTIFPLNSGIRLGYAPSEGVSIIELLFGIDLYNF